jgi:CBS domain-containing membrane protein
VRGGIHQQSRPVGAIAINCVRNGIVYRTHRSLFMRSDVTRAIFYNSAKIWKKILCLKLVHDGKNLGNYSSGLPNMSVFHRLNPSLVPTSIRERLRSAIGALTGICLTGMISSIAIGSDAGLPLLIAPMGASAVLLFAAPTSPLAQPWSILGGNLVSATIGVTCAMAVASPLIAAGLAVSLAIGTMLVFNCLHPPSGAVALTAVLGGAAVHNAGYWFILSPVAINSVIILAVALLFNNATGRRYPHFSPKTENVAIGTVDPLPGHRLGTNVSDIKAVLAEYDEVVDVSPDELDILFHRAQIRAFNRHAVIVTCGDIMSRDLVTVTAATSLKTAWHVFMVRNVRALPVLDGEAKLVGILTPSDFLKNSVLSDDGHLRLGFGRRFAASVLRRHAPRIVADIMTTKVQSAAPHTPINLLVSPMVDQGLDRMPVVDHEKIGRASCRERVS